MDSFEYARNISRTVAAAMAAMPRPEMGGNNFPEPVQFFFETPENVPPFFDSDHPFFDTDDNQVADNLNIPTIFKYADDYVLLNVNENNLNYFLILIVALWYLTTSN